MQLEVSVRVKQRRFEGNFKFAISTFRRKLEYHSLIIKITEQVIQICV